jgi:CHASE1-domain containing sensor protein
MTLPTVSFKEFLTSPITALLFMCVMALGYLYVAQTNTLEEQVINLQQEVKLLQDDNKKLNAKIIEILTEVKKANP